MEAAYAVVIPFVAFAPVFTLQLRRASVVRRVEAFADEGYANAIHGGFGTFEDRLREWKRRVELRARTRYAPLWQWTPDAAREALARGAR